MNHEFIDNLVKTCEKNPQQTIFQAVTELAYILEMCLRDMEQSGESITRHTLEAKFGTPLKNKNKKNINYEFIDTLIGIYDQFPESQIFYALQTIAVVVHSEFEEMEKSGEIITRESLLKKFDETLEKYKGCRAKYWELKGLVAKYKKAA